MEPDIVDSMGDGASSSTMCPCINLPVMTSLARSSVYSSAESSSPSAPDVGGGPWIGGPLARGIRDVEGDVDSGLVDWIKGLEVIGLLNCRYGYVGGGMPFDWGGVRGEFRCGLLDSSNPPETPLDIFVDPSSVSWLGLCPT